MTVREGEGEGWDVFVWIFSVGGGQFDISVLWLEIFE